MKIKLSLLFLLSVLFFNSFAQSKTAEYFFTISTNVYLPGGSSGKSSYPILGYNDDYKPSFQVGGFGLGAGVFIPLSDKLLLKAQGNFSRYAYWDQSHFLTDVNAVALGTVYSHSYDYTFGTTGTLHYSFAEKFSMGTGLGFQVLLTSFSIIPKFDMSFSNKDYKTVMPMLPFELTYKSEKFTFSTRYELALLNRLKGDLADYKTEKYSLLVFEAGFRIK